MKWRCYPQFPTYKIGMMAPSPSALQELNGPKILIRNYLFFVARIFRKVGPREENWLSFPTKISALALSSWLDMLGMFSYFLVNLLSISKREGETPVLCVCVGMDV